MPELYETRSDLFDYSCRQTAGSLLKDAERAAKQARQLLEPCSPEQPVHQYALALTAEIRCASSLAGAYPPQLHGQAPEGSKR